MSEANQRAAVIAEARSWIGTPYHHMGRLKGVGVDCLMLLALVYARAGVIPELKIPFYPPDWHLHRPRAGASGELLLNGVSQHAAEVVHPGPGDIALWHIGRAFAHGAIVVAWPRIIHAVVRRGVMEADGTDPHLGFERHGKGARARKFMSPWTQGPVAAGVGGAAGGDGTKK